MARQGKRAQWASYIKSGKLQQRPSGTTPATLARKAFKGIILGIDPSLRGTGLAVVEFIPPATGGLMFSETVRPGMTAGLPECLGMIAEAVERLIDAHKPLAVAVEETIYVQNLRTAQKLGAARGAAIGCAARLGVPVYEYSPLRIKQAVVGYGRASKEQVARQMRALLKMGTDLSFDEADAAATAFCHAMTLGRS